MSFYLNEDGSGYYWLEDESGFLELEDANPPINAPFIDDNTIVYAPTVANDSSAQITQAPVEVLLEPEPDAQITQAPVEVLVLVLNPELQLTQAPVEVLRRATHEVYAVVYID